MADRADEIIKTIKQAIDKKTFKRDRTYRTVTKRIEDHSIQKNKKSRKP